MTLVDSPLEGEGFELLAFKIWEEEVNAEGGLLGRPVKLVYYDDQSKATPRWCRPSTPS
jgi:branched-chain amino acid transport system substrate-binding protein